MKGAAPTIRRNRSGFSLIELIIAILLMVGGISSATYIFGRGVFATTDAEAMEQAIALAQEKMENIRGTVFASINSESKASVAGWSGFSRQVNVTQPAGTNSNFKQVVVTVYWTPGETELSTSLTTFLVNP